MSIHRNSGLFAPHCEALAEEMMTGLKSRTFTAAPTAMLRAGKEPEKLTEDEIADLKEKKVIGDLEYDWAGPMPDYFARRIEED